jgi:hypothetical protein
VKSPSYITGDPFGRITGGSYYGFISRDYTPIVPVNEAITEDTCILFIDVYTFCTNKAYLY